MMVCPFSKAFLVPENGSWSFMFEFIIFFGILIVLDLYHVQLNFS
jgi:hypothetical protein